MIAPQEIERRIKDALPGSAVEVRDMTGGSDHFDIRVVSELFDGKSPIERHRMVHAPLKDVLGGALHAIQLETRTPGE